MNKQITLGVMGQVNHGKKTLINAINSSTDNNYEYINFETNKELTSRNIDTAILVVDVLEGTMTQTREQILTAKQLGIKNIIVFINKCDNINNKDLINEVKYLVVDLLFAYGYNEEDISIITGSALKAIEGKKEDIEKIIELTTKINKITPNNKKSKKLIKNHYELI